MKTAIKPVFRCPDPENGLRGRCNGFASQQSGNLLPVGPILFTGGDK